MRLDMFAVINIEPALEQAGCPICRIRQTFETRYIAGLLHEYVNDYESRTHIIASLGYCAKHAWQMGLMEREKFGDAVGNAIIYENLINVTLRPLIAYQKAYEARSKKFRDRFIRWLRALRGWPLEENRDPYGSLVRSTCHVCQIGENSEKNYLEWLLIGLSEPDPELREAYLLSDGLCFQHFRQALLFWKDPVESGIQFLIGRTLETLPKLCKNLREYTDKHAWDRHQEPLTQDERLSWIQAIRFFAGNEGNLLLDDLTEKPSDDRVNNNLKEKFD
jgi:hypothetical protein